LQICYQNYNWRKGQMKFCRDELDVFETYIGVVVTLIVFLFFLLGLKPSEPLLLISLMSTILLTAIICYNWHKPQIEITTETITCRKKQKILWKYKWDEIKALRIGNRFRHPSIEFEFATSDRNEQRLIEEVDPYFQYGRSAKKALKQYCPCPITKITSKAPFYRFPKD